MHERTLLGREGEALVAKYLEDQGLQILVRNYSQRSGEIDLIASGKQLLIFVEVKFRASAYGDLTAIVNHTKQKKMISAAKHYMAKHKIDDDTVCRFDVALVQGIENPQITYIPNAFTEGGW